MQERPLLEATLENCEAIVDGLSEDGVLKDIPVVGTLIKLGKAVQSIKDRLFIARVEAFVDGLGRDPENVAKWREQIAEDETEAGRVGEALLLVVERSEDLRKARLLGLLFLTLLDRVVGPAEFRRLTRAVDIAFMDDLDALFTTFRDIDPTEDSYGEDQYPFVATLAGTGLTRFAVVNQPDDGSQCFECTPLALSLLKAYRHACQRRQTENN